VRRRIRHDPRELRRSSPALGRLALRIEGTLLKIVPLL